MKFYQEIQTTPHTLMQYELSSKQAHVHSVFNHVVNIVTVDNTLFTLTDATLNSGPNCFNVKDINLTSINLQEGTPVYLDKQSILIKDQVLIDISNPLITLQSSPSITFNPLIVEIINVIESSHVYETYHKSESLFEKTVDQMIAEKSMSIILSLKNNNKNTVYSTLKTLIGLGVGLTPSGDDFLCGLAYISSLEGFSNPFVQDLMKQLLQDIAQNTNLISLTQYENALKGQVRMEVNETTQAILDPQANSDEILEKLSILNIGSTSGFDMLSGILFGIKISLLQEEKK